MLFNQVKLKAFQLCLSVYDGFAIKNTLELCSHALCTRPANDKEGLISEVCSGSAIKCNESSSVVCNL